MTRGSALGIMLAFATVCIEIVDARPDWSSDNNSFFKGFVTHEYINVLGVILAITLASAAQIHLAFNRIEEQHKVRNALEKSRRELRRATLSLIILFVVGVLIVALKPIAGAGSATGESVFNLASMFVLLWQVLILVSLTELVFHIEPEFFDQPQRGSSTDLSRPDEPRDTLSPPDTSQKNQQ